MTTNLKVNKFRTRKPKIDKAVTPRPVKEVQPEPVASPQPDTAQQDLRADPAIQAIMNEGLTPRQLRIARRKNKAWPLQQITRP